VRSSSTGVSSWRCANASRAATSTASACSGYCQSALLGGNLGMAVLSTGPAGARSRSLGIPSCPQRTLLTGSPSIHRGHAMAYEVPRRAGRYGGNHRDAPTIDVRRHRHRRFQRTSACWPRFRVGAAIGRTRSRRRNCWRSSTLSPTADRSTSIGVAHKLPVIRPHLHIYELRRYEAWTMTRVTLSVPSLM
jgi:hypothetical protein